MQLFEHVNDTAEDKTTLVCVLIDEVESIVSARSSSLHSSEPGDSFRVVNAVLTSLDALKKLSNVLILCTSNMVDSIDSVR
jgi:SpoVK/Ycf46/Vps4 family AAA+-type ATPase